MQVEITTIAAFLVGSIAVGRAARLIVDDDFPPVAWLREKYILAVGPKWGMLVECSFCISIWFALPNLLLAWVTDLSWVWWVPNLWFAGAYLGAILNARDVPSD